MKKLNVIPYPNKVTFTDGEADAAVVAKNVTEVIDSVALGESEYILEVKADGVSITAGSKKAAFYAGQTLNQLAAKTRIPCVVIEDKPAFSYRGFMLDTVRHITTIENTKKLIDAAASMKMNAMHWHLSDDQGWRAEINSRPELMNKASKRKASQFGDENDITEYGGWFTKEQLKEIVDYAAQRYIEVIPEIDMPGHMTAAIHAYPEISCRGEKVDVITKQGIFPEILCAGKEETFSFAFDVLGELMEIFPSRYIHIGGDEAPKKRWKECPDCQKRISELALKDEEELQGWFVNRISSFLAENGREAIVWNESLKSTLVSGVTVQRWMDRKEKAVEYANNGGKVIMSDFYHYYCDYPYAMTPLKKTYDYNPYIKGLTARGKENVIGIEAPIWTEYIRDFDRLCYMFFPRFSAAAEAGWTERKHMDEQDFERRFVIFTKQLSAMGITPAPRTEWNPGVWKRLSGTLKFFKPVISNGGVNE